MSTGEIRFTAPANGLGCGCTLFIIAMFFVGLFVTGQYLLNLV